MFKNYLITAVRDIRRHKLYAFINIFGLALGLAVFMLIFLFIQLEFSYDKFHEKHDRIYRIEQRMVLNNQTVQDAGLPPPLSRALKADFPEFEAITRIQDGGSPLISLRDTKGIIVKKCFFADNSFFDIFSFPWIKGNRHTALAEPRSAVITEDAARALFGNEEALGKIIRWNHRYDLNITGVLKRVPANSHLQFDLLISYSSAFATRSKRTLEDWYSNWLPLYVLLHKNHSSKEMNKKIRLALRRHQIGNPYNSELYLKPLTKIHLHSHIKSELGSNGDIKNIYIFTAVALFVLIIACINFMNLVTARSADRAREIGVRKVLGANRSTLMNQFMGEAILTAILSMCLAVALVELLLPEFNSIVNRNLKIDYLNNWPISAGLIIITILVGVFSGFYPAILLSSLRPVQTIKGKLSSGTRSILLRQFLVGFQFFISIVLIIGTVIIMQQVNFLLNKDLGFDGNQILIIHTRHTTPAKNRLFRSRILQHPNVLKVGVSDYLPYHSSNWTGFSWEGAAKNQGIKVNINYIDENVLDTYGMVIVKGQGFSKGQMTDQSQVAILNEEAVRQMRVDDPVGKRINYPVDYRSRDWKGATIVGIVKDYHFLSLHETISPLMLRFYSDGMTGSNISVKIANQQIPETVEFLQKTFENRFPLQEFNCRFLDEDFRSIYQEEKKTSKIISYLAILAIFISCLGLFGLTNFSIRQRTKEIGIRKALGASVPNIVSYLIAEFLKLLLIANVLAWPAAYLVMNYWLQNFPYRIDIQISLFIVAGVLAVLIALITVLYQALKAASANPVEALRYE
jgi:putative ABC transport system permease protein